MPKAVKISDELASTAAVFAGVEGRSLAGQVEYWANLGRVADENADLPVSFIKEILIARAQVRIGLKTPYEFDENEVLLVALGAHENFYRDLKRYLA